MIQPAASPTLALSARRILRAAPERVFQAWTQPADLKRWFAPSPEFTVPIVEVDLRVGGRYRLGMQGPGRPLSVATGVYQEITAPSRLVFTWRWEDAPPESPDTRVIVEFHPKDGGTELILVHENFADAADRDDHEAGWIGSLDLLVVTLAD